MKHTFIVAMMSCLCVSSFAQALAAPASYCTAQVLHSEELPYGPLGSWLVRATMKVTPSRGQAFAFTVSDYAPWQMTLRRGDTFHFDCRRLEAFNLGLRLFR